MPQIVHLAERSPQVSADQLLEAFQPSYRFGEVSFDSYIPDPAHPSQAEAVERPPDRTAAAWPARTGRWPASG